MNRREFLKTAAVGSAAVVTTGALAADNELAPRPKPKAPMQGLRRDMDMPHPNLDPEDYAYVGGAKPYTGKVTCGGKPLAGVIVSNGRDSVKTGKDGVYTLPIWKDARFVTITTPSGYRSNWHYADTGRLLGGFNFSLEGCGQTAAGKPCRFVHIADSEIKWAGWAGFTKDIKALADRTDCAFIVHTGDICGREGLIAHSQVMNEVNMGRRCVYCAGNHDLVSLWPWGEAEFEAIYGPSWYSFEACGVHFLVTPHVNGDRNPSYDEDTLADWIRGDLALVDPKMPVVLFRHYPPNASNYEKAGVVFGDKRPIDLREACNYKGCVYGHSHNTWLWRNGNATMVNTSNPNIGGIDHSPNSARVVTVSDKGISCETFFGDMSPMKSERAGAAWETKLPAAVMWGGFADGGDTLYCATSDDDGAGTGFICALAKADGAIKWKAKVGNTIKSTLALASGLVIGTDVESKVYAVDAATGKLAWTKDLASVNRRGAYHHMVSHGTVASPDGKQIVAGIGYTQTVLDAATGNVVWFDGGQYQQEACPIAPAFVDGKVLTPYNWADFVCNDAKTGKVLWKFGGCRFPGARPLVRGDKVIVGSAAFLYELDLASGKVLRKENYGGKPFSITGDIVETENFYLKGTVGRGLIAIDKKTLKIAWEAKTQPGLVGNSEYCGKGMASLGTTPALVDANTVCATCADGIIHFWNLADGKEVRQIKTGAPYLASAVVSDGKVFVVDMTGTARAFAV